MNFRARMPISKKRSEVSREISRELSKLNLTHSAEKLNSNAVIKIFVHDFARYVRLDEGVILDAR
jgi:hypothetical protein